MVVGVLTANVQILSFWYFGGTNYTPEVDKQIMVDNIKENYTPAAKVKDKVSFVLYKKNPVVK